MTDFPRNLGLPTHVNSQMRYFDFQNLQGLAGPGSFGGTLTTGIVGGTPIYLPFWLPWSYLISRFFWCNGNSATGTADIGIYSPGGGLISSTGAVNVAGTSTVQYAALGTPIVLPAGRYLLGHVRSVANVYGVSYATLASARMMGIMQGPASQATLPAAAAFAALTMSYYPLIGFTSSASGW